MCIAIPRSKPIKSWFAPSVPLSTAADPMAPMKEAVAQLVAVYGSLEV